MTILRAHRFVTMIALLLLTAASAAHAQPTRSWVSGLGDDANPCSRTAPCKTFAGAISKTAAGGEIDVLDSGGFGAVTITKSISIEALGTVAGVLVPGTNAIVVAAGANDNVVLKGLTIEGVGTGLNGVRVTSAGSVTVENCTINNFTQNGIDFEPNNGGGASQLFVHDTIIRHNGSSANTFGGISVAPGGGTAAGGVIGNVRLEGNNGFGVRLADNTNLSVRDSVAINHLGGIAAGFAVVSPANSGSLFVTGSTASNNAGSGVLLNGGFVRATEMTVTGNATGFNNVSGAANTFFTFGTNWLDGNPTPTSGAITALTPQ